MTEPIKVFLTEAFMPLLKDLDTFGAMFRAEADQQFGVEFIEAALARKVCAELETSYGVALVLSARGRTRLGYAGYYKATRQSAEANVCLRDAYLNIQASGKATEQLELQRKRRNAIVYRHDGRRVLALVNPEGYNRTVARRIYKAEILTGEFDELHLYSYLPLGEVMRFGELLLHSTAPDALEIDESRVLLYAIKPWPEAHSD